ncbi:MAG: TlpA family protein disulfide reductase [Gemmatimonadetes bacterium]|nr:TlpA family protein disulfide reductase [Gemmatimonadota bacterium]MBI3504478.1 TlpA family protein disulfide reductase [Pseudomonadota bacterium]
MDAEPAVPPPSGGWRRWLTTGNILTLVFLLVVAPRLLPHVGAIVGVGSGEGTPRFDVRTLEGTRLASDSLRGHVVLVNVWATWCLPCRAEMPLLEGMYERHKARGFVLAGFSVDRAPAADVAAFVREHGVHYPIAIIGDAEIAAFGGVQGYPTSFLLDRAGRVRYRVVGPIAPVSLELAVRRLLDEK